MSDPVTVLLTGATGFIGRRVAPALVEAGHTVRAMTRHPETYDGPGEPVGGDVSDPDSLAAPLEGVDVAIYLVHSLDKSDFIQIDADGAIAFGKAAKAAGVRQIVFLGGLGSEDESQLSDHLRSRRQVERLLGEAGVPVTTLRAAIIIGAGSISWELTRQLVKNLPAMVVPKWVATRTQPIAIDDVIRYVVGVVDVPEAFDRVFDIGCPESMTYLEMMQTVSEVSRGRKVPIIVVPLLTPRLSSYWISFVSDVEVTTARNLIESMGTEVVVRDTSIRDIVPGEPLSYEESVRRALEDRGRHTEEMPS